MYPYRMTRPTGLYALDSDPLRGFIPDDILNSTQVELRVPERVCVECAQAYSPGAMVKVGSNPRQGLIVLHPSHYRPGTATGEALRGHELYHEWQRRNVPDFDRAFAQEAARIESQRLPPWANAYERPAYEFEATVKEMLLAQGYRP